MTRNGKMSNDDISDIIAQIAAKGPPEADLSHRGERIPESDIQPTESQETGKKSELGAEPARAMLLDARTKRADHKRSLEVYKQYQESVKTSSQLKTDILRGLDEGEDTAALLLKAAKAITLMTDDGLFYRQVEASLLSVYGRALLEETPLKMELAGVRGRLQKLRDAQGQAPGDSRLASAIRAHEDTERELISLIQESRMRKAE